MGKNCAIGNIITHNIIWRKRRKIGSGLVDTWKVVGDEWEREKGGEYGRV